MSEWISVRDKMPKPGTELLAYANEYIGQHFQIIKAVYYDRFQMKGTKPEFKFYESCHCSGYERDEMMVGEVSHWMPLPEPPKKDLE